MTSFEHWWRKHNERERLNPMTQPATKHVAEIAFNAGMKRASDVAACAGLVDASRVILEDLKQT